MKHILLILFIFLISGELISQTEDPKNLKQKVDSLKLLGRDSLIKLAIKKTDQGFDASGYDRISVKAFNDKLLVEFSLSVKLVDGTCFYDQVTIALIGNGTSSSIQGDCNQPKYYKLTSKRRKKIQFVFDAINKSDEVGDIKDNKIDNGNTMTVTEKLTNYYVEVDSWSTHSHYEVNKITSKITNANHKHYARDKNEKPEFEIVN